MKHKQYESWILDEAPLTDSEQQELGTHLKICDHCRKLQNNWIASKQLIGQSVMQTPQPGFADRWQATLLRKIRVKKIRRYRLTIFGIVMLTFVSSVTYMLISGSFMQIFVNGFTMISELILRLTNNLSTFGYWISRLPIAVPITAGFLFFGLINAFLMVGLFFLWNLKQRKMQTNEITLE